MHGWYTGTWAQLYEDIRAYEALLSRAANDMKRKEYPIKRTLPLQPLPTFVAPSLHEARPSSPMMLPALCRLRVQVVAERRAVSDGRRLPKLTKSFSPRPMNASSAPWSSTPSLQRSISLAMVERVKHSSERIHNRMLQVPEYHAPSMPTDNIRCTTPRVVPKLTPQPTPPTRAALPPVPPALPHPGKFIAPNPLPLPSRPARKPLPVIPAPHKPRVSFPVSDPPRLPFSRLLLPRPAPSRGSTGLAGVSTRPAGLPTRGAPPAAARQLQLNTHLKECCASRIGMLIAWDRTASRRERAASAVICRNARRIGRDHISSRRAQRLLE